MVTSNLATSRSLQELMNHLLKLPLVIRSSFINHLSAGIQNVSKSYFSLKTPSTSVSQISLWWCSVKLHKFYSVIRREDLHFTRKFFSKNMYIKKIIYTPEKKFSLILFSLMWQNYSCATFLCPRNGWNWRRGCKWQKEEFCEEWLFPGQMKPLFVMCHCDKSHFSSFG